MRLSHDNLLTHFLGKVPYTSWLFTIYKKIPEILVGNFGSVNPVRVVHHLPKSSGLSRRASRLDSSYKMKLVRNSRNLMHQSIAAVPSPAPPATADHLPALSVPGVGHLKILCWPGTGHLPTPGPFPSFWHAGGFLSEYNYTEGLTGKKQIGSSVKGRNKLKRVVRPCSWFYACISSLLIKPELDSEIIGSYRCVNQRVLVVESNFCWYYLKNILSYLKNYS